MKVLSHKTAVVIGGGSGVGRGIAFGLSAQGMNIVVADINHEAALKVKDEILGNDGQAIALQVDSTSTSSLAKLAALTVEAYSHVDVLVNAVGVILERPLVEVSDEEWQWVWQLNVMSQIKSVNVFLPQLRMCDEAHIILTVSGAGMLTTNPGMKIGAYSTSKHALVGYASNLRSELKNEGIGVSMICPSGVVGNLAANSAKSYKAVVGKTASGVGGEQPAGRVLADGSEMGALAVEAITQNRPLVSNKTDELKKAMSDEYAALFGG